MNRLLFQLFALQVVFLGIAFGLFSSGSGKIKQGTKYQLQQNAFTLGTSYVIKDDKDKPVYKVGFKQLGLGKHLQLTDVSGQREYYSIKHVVNPLGLAKYEIRENNQVIAEVNRKFNIGGKKFNVQSKLGSLRIEGNFRSREFKIKKGHELVATISKKFFAIGDKYGVKVEQRYQENAPFFLCLAIVVDEVAHD